MLKLKIVVSENAFTQFGIQGRTKNTRIRGRGGGIESRRHNVGGISCKGMRGGHPLSYRGFGGSPRENVGNCGAGEAFLSLF